MLSLKEVKNQFSTLLNSINKTDKKNFIEFVFEELACMEGGYFDDGKNMHINSYLKLIFY